MELLRRGDHGAAFLKIMRGFERARGKRDLCVGVLRSERYPVQIVWGEHDPALTLAVHGELARKAAGVDVIHRLIHRLPAKHFPQDDQAPAIAELVATVAGGPSRRFTPDPPRVRWRCFVRS